MRILAIIPARWASSRLPQKALTMIHGKTMIQRVYERVMQVSEVTHVVVATDHPSIFEHVRSFGGEVVMTQEDIPSGTDRCAVAMQLLRTDFPADFVINVQGDEPLIEPESLRILIKTLSPNTKIATLVTRIRKVSDLINPNVVKVVVNNAGNALYFSRQAIPYMRDEPLEEWLIEHTYWKHIGIYAFQPQTLVEVTNLPISQLENAEKLEQLRWLDAGIEIKTTETPFSSLGVDTLADLEEVRAQIAQLIDR